MPAFLRRGGRRWLRPRSALHHDFGSTSARVPGELAASLAALFEPGVGRQVVVEGDEGAVVEDDGVVHARDGVLAPPLVVDPPAVLDGDDGAWDGAAVTPDGDDAPPGIGPHPQRTGRI